MNTVTQGWKNYEKAVRVFCRSLMSWILIFTAEEQSCEQPWHKLKTESQSVTWCIEAPLSQLWFWFLLGSGQTSMAVSSGAVVSNSLACLCVPCVLRLTAITKKHAILRETQSCRGDLHIYLEFKQLKRLFWCLDWFVFVLPWQQHALNLFNWFKSNLNTKRV